MIVRYLDSTVYSWRAGTTLDFVHIVPYRWLNFDCVIDDNVGRRVERFLGATLRDVNVRLERSYVPFDDRDPQAFGPPCPIMDMKAPEERPLGVATCFQEIISIRAYPGQAFFDDLWSTKTHGGVMPQLVSFSVLGHGDQSAGTIDLSLSENEKMAVISLEFQTYFEPSWHADAQHDRGRCRQRRNLR